LLGFMKMLPVVSGNDIILGIIKRDLGSKIILL